LGLGLANYESVLGGVAIPYLKLSITTSWAVTLLINSLFFFTSTTTMLTYHPDSLDGFVNTTLHKAGAQLSWSEAKHSVMDVMAWA